MKLNVFRPGLLKRTIFIILELATLVVAFALMVPLFIVQSRNGEFMPILCILVSSLLLVGLLVLIISYLLFAFTKIKYSIKKRIDLIATIVGRALVFIGFVLHHFASRSEAIAWLARSNVTFGWFAIAVFVFLIINSVKELTLINDSNDETLNQVYEEADKFMNREATRTNKRTIEPSKEKAYDDNVIEAEVVDKD